MAVLILFCPQSTLTPGQQMTCTACGTAVSGQYVNLGEVSATAPVGPPVSDSDLSHYYGGERTEEIYVDGFESPQP